LWDAANAVLRDRGFEWTAAQVSEFDQASLRSHLRMGARRVGRILFVQIFGTQMTVSTLHPHAHFARRGGAGPTFVVTPPSPGD
jgi:hypothetical protein